MLVKKIDALVVAQQEKKLAAVVNFPGEADDETTEKIKKFGEKQRLKKVPLAVTSDGDKFEINDDAEVSVMIYRGKKVKFNYALGKGGLDQKTVAAIVKDTKKMLKEPVEEPREKPKGKKGSPKAKSKEKPDEKPKEDAKGKEEPKPKGE